VYFTLAAIGGYVSYEEMVFMIVKGVVWKACP
jgi:hypothetical protein